MPYDSSNKMKGMPMKGMPMHSGAPHMESAKQERKNLMDDNPVTRTAAGDRPWISKHFRSMGGSPVKHYDTSKGSHSHPHDMSKGTKMDSPNPDLRPKMDHK